MVLIQQKEEAMSINVPPVTGMSPPMVAKELRSLIRDHIWQGVKRLGLSTEVDGASSNYQSLVARHKALVEQHMRLTNDLVELKEIAKRRKPSETKIKVDQMCFPGGPVYEMINSRERLWSYARWFADRVLKGGGANEEQRKILLANAQRAYALVQALPTIDNPSIGKAENTLRVITTLVKAYHGLEFDATEKALPEIIPALLASLKATVEEPQPEEKHEGFDVHADPIPEEGELVDEGFVPHLDAPPNGVPLIPTESAPMTQTVSAAYQATVTTDNTANSF